MLRLCRYMTVLVALWAWSAGASDWPMWRHDAGRTAAAAEELPDNLEVQWIRTFSPRVMAWEEPLNQDRMPYDAFFEPIVLGKTLFVGFNDSDKLLALDVDTGEERWRYYTDGPVRLPPVAYHTAGGARVIFTSDDGLLYCLDADTGEPVWQFRGGPEYRRILGNKRLISTWPARGGPVVQDGVVYFAAGIWPFMGVFIYALDAASGEMIWENDGTSAVWINQPHRNPSFAGVAPQGALVVAGDRLLIPGGRSVPACYDLKTGRYLYYRLDEDKPNNYGKTGGSFVCASGGVFFNHHVNDITTLYNAADGMQLKEDIGRFPVLTEDTFYLSGKSIEALTAAPEPARRWKMDADASRDLIKAGRRLYAAGGAGITAIELSDGIGPGTVAWTHPVDGDVVRLLAADGKLFAVTQDGSIIAFGRKGAASQSSDTAGTVPAPSAEAVTRAKELLQATGVREGYSLVFGIEDPDLLAALALESDLTLVAFVADETRVDAIRRSLDARGLYGTRVAVHAGDASSLDLPSYVASLTIVGRAATVSGDNVDRIYRSMRPYGGTAWLPLTGDAGRDFARTVEARELPGLRVTEAENGVLLCREGPLPGAAYWTHQYGDAANTVKSDDTLVKMPLGLLWFGGNTNADVLPRHGHGPPEQIVGGRLYIQGLDSMSARDVYTGRVLWKTDLGDLGTFGVYYDATYKTNQQHIPGANARGTNFVVAADTVYIVRGGDCLLLDAVTGEHRDTFSLKGDAPEWGYIGVYENLLLGGCDFAAFSELATEEEGLRGLPRKGRPVRESGQDGQPATCRHGPSHGRSEMGSGGAARIHPQRHRHRRRRRFLPGQASPVHGRHAPPARTPDARYLPPAGARRRNGESEMANRRRRVRLLARLLERARYSGPIHAPLRGHGPR